MVPPDISTVLVEQFWECVDRSDADGCWPWIGRINRHGYGRWTQSPPVFGIWRSHRAAYELTIWPIPAGLDLDHLCRNRACVNPDHLEPVTRRENLRRGGVARRTASYGSDWALDAVARYPAESLAQLAARYDVHRQTVAKVLREQGVQIQPRGDTRRRSAA